MKKGQIYEGTVEKVSFPNKCTVAVEGEERKVIMKHALPGLPAEQGEKRKM